MSHTRRSYSLRDDKKPFHDAEVEVVVLVNGNPSSRLVVPHEGMFTLRRVSRGYDLNLIEPGERRLTEFGEGEEALKPWQFEAMRDEVTE